MASLTDWMARTFFISDEDEATYAAVAEHQQSLVDELNREGKVSAPRYLALSEEISQTGPALFDKELGKKGVAGLPGVWFSYWWIWLPIGLVALWWFWPAIRPVLNRFKR